MKVFLFLGFALYVSVATYLADRFLIGRSLVGSGELILPAVIMAPAALIAGLVNVQLLRAFVAYIVLCATCIVVSTLTTPGESFFDLTGAPAWYTAPVFVLVFTALICVIYAVPLGLIYVAGRALRRARVAA
jgi:hypothetical protein